MRECSGTPANRQAQNSKFDRRGLQANHGLGPLPFDAPRKPLDYPGFSSLAFGPRPVASDFGPDCKASFSYSSIFRPDQNPALTALLLDSQNDVYWSDVYRMDVVFRRKRTDSGLQEPKEDRPLRGKVSQFSYKSGLRLKHQVRNASMEVKSQFILTYPDQFPKSGKIVKNHLDRLLHSLRKAYGATNFGYEWILEFQERGAPHFHLYLTWIPSNELRRFIAKRWNHILKAGKEHLWQHLRPRTFAKWDMGKGNYVMKYAQKMEQKQVPAGFEDVGHFWGASRNMKPIAMRYDYAELAKEAATGWAEDQIRLYFQRSMRRYHDSQLRLFGKSSFLGHNGWSRVKVPNGTRVFHQLCEWVYQIGPPSGDMKYRGPQGGPVPF